jgi:hypothetical protein
MDTPSTSNEDAEFNKWNNFCIQIPLSESGCLFRRHLEQKHQVSENVPSEVHRVYYNNCFGSNHYEYNFKQAISIV